MRKSYIYILLTVSLLILISILSNDNKTFNIDGIKYAVSVDGVNQDSFPNKGAYDVTINCTNGAGIWNYDKWIVEVSNVTGNVSCDISFTSKSTVYLNNYIKNTLTGTTVGDGQVVNENGYRYEGKNPNNYIMFNNEVWRIIGVFDASSHGQPGEYLTKIIREDSVGGLAWDKDYNNNWATSSLYNLLNGAYYNAEDGTDSGYCYQEGTTISGICDYRVKGVKEEYRSMVKNVTWYLGGYTNTSTTASNFFAYERSNDETYYVSGNNKIVDGYIGLMYLSDYGYSVLSSSCARTINLSDYYTSNCAGSLWLRTKAYEWTITHSIFTKAGLSVFAINYDNTGVYRTNTYSGYSIRPTLYLDQSVYIVHGDGSLTNPYIINM